MTENVSIKISKDLYLKASAKVDVTEWVNKQLSLLILDDFSEEYETLLLLNEKIEEIKVLEARLSELHDNRVNEVDVGVFDDAMITITRIHTNLGMVGKNQIKQISKRNNLPYESLLKYVMSEGFTVVNYTGVKK